MTTTYFCPACTKGPSDDPNRHVSMADPLRGGKRAPENIKCSSCTRTEIFQATDDFAGALHKAGWSFKFGP